MILAPLLKLPKNVGDLGNSYLQKALKSCPKCKKSPNVYKSCPNMISLEKWMILAPLQKLPKNVKDLGKLIVPKGIKKLPKVQKIANYGHTGHNM